MDAKEEVRSRLNIEDVIGEYVQLKRAGRNFKGLSPFGNERTPSFVVSPEKQIWHDFSSGKGGDVFGFVMEVEGMDFRQALEHLARKAGVDLSLYQSEKGRDTAQKKKRLIEMHVWAMRFFQHTMVKNTKALEYIFKKRHFNKQTVQTFGIGYAPSDKKALLTFLSSKGFSRGELEAGGVLNRFGGDLFRDRMMVPLMDASGQTIGFTGRIIGDVDNAPKYLNTPQTLLYDKSRHVFGLSQAKDAIRKKNRAVIVEGNLDVVSSYQAGVEYVVATAGTAMTEYHLQALKRLTTDIRLAFDGDKAGIAATERAIEIGSQVGVELTIISLPDGAKDPDELIQKDPLLWEQAIDAAQPAVDWVLEQYMKREDTTTTRGKRAFATAGLQLIARLQDPVERDHYQEKVAAMIGSSKQVIVQKSQTYEMPTQATPKKTVKETAPVRADVQETMQDDILALAATSLEARALLKNDAEQLFDDQKRQVLCRYLVQHNTELLEDVPDDLQQIENYVKIVLLRADTRYVDSTNKVKYAEITRLIRMRQNEQKKQKQTQLLAQLKDVEQDDDNTRADQLRVELNNLIKEIARG